MSEMPNNNLENLSPPEKLTDQEVKKILEKVDDDRLRSDEDIEHFTIHINDKVVNIPKRQIIHVQDSLGRVDNVKIEDYIERVIKEHDQAQQN